MSGLVESATAIMRMAERRLEVVAHNVANVATPGYKRQIGFAAAVAAGRGGDPSATDLAVRRIDDQGKLQQTGNPFDLALGDAGYFKLRAGDAMLYTRQGQFSRSADGTLVTPQGYVLQQAGGGDIVLDGADAAVAVDGTVLEAGRPVARIAVERPVAGVALTAVGDSFFSAGTGEMADADQGVVRQGMVEGSNVSLGDEMTQSMLALRQAENGARLIQLYDDLMGRAVGAFGGAGR